MLRLRSSLLALAALFVCGQVDASIAAAIRFDSVRLTPSFTIDTRYLDGDDGTAAIPLAWAPIPNISVLTSDTGSVNLCSSYLTQLGTPNATISLVAGYAWPSTFTLGGTDNCVLSWTTPSVSSAIVRVQAQRLTNVAQTNEFSVSATAPISGDTKAPTIPTGCVATNGAGEVTIECDASSDPYATTPGAVTRYDFIPQTSGATVTLTAPSPGLSLPLTLTNVGTISSPGAPSCTQQTAATDWSCDAAGTGFVENTADQAAFLGAQVTGAASLAVRVDAVTSGSNFARAGPCARSSWDANAAEICTTVQPGNGNLIQCRGRATVGANKTTWGSATAALPVRVRTSHNGAGLGVCEYSTDGATWIAVTAAQSIPALGASPVMAIGMSSTTAGTNRTFTLAQVNLNNAPRISKTITTSVAQNVVVTARDAAGNVSAASAFIAIAPTSGGGPDLRQKFTPGVYGWSGALRHANCGTASCHHDKEINFQNATCAEANIRGWMIRMYPQSMWNADDTPNFAIWDEYIDHARACGKKIIAGMQPVAFGATGACTLYFTPKICNVAGYGITVTGTGAEQKTFMRVWQANTVDEQIRWWTAFGQRYNDEPVIEGIEPTLESAINVGNGVDGFSYGSLTTQFVRLFQGIKPAWANTVLRFHANYMDTAANIVTVYTACRSLGCSFGGPDVLPREPIQSNQVQRGCTQPKVLDVSVGCPNYSGTTDLDGYTPNWAEVQSPELGGKEGTWTPLQLWRTALGLDGSDNYIGTYNPAGCTNSSAVAGCGWGYPAKAVNPTHFIWYYNQTTGNASTQWGNGSTQGILWFIRSHGSTGHTACPLDYVANRGGCK